MVPRTAQGQAVDMARASHPSVLRVGTAAMALVVAVLLSPLFALFEMVLGMLLLGASVISAARTAGPMRQIMFVAGLILLFAGGLYVSAGLLIDAFSP
ncbi:hypothetical protein [Embleya sp. NBC_00896]|uniref:hypothetical protein n=1 Tax=Embleya sp. NBC_00896 TaxID=2975961 RepID=UPI003870C351|nr:hypothetical protein OG928_23125 [Embleya sp. NBC_00896]